MSNGAGKFWGGFLVGSAVGVLVGLSVTPRSRKQAKRLLRKSAEVLPEIAEGLTANVQYRSVSLRGGANRLTESAQKTMSEALERLREAIAIGQEASQKLRQELNLSTTAPEIDQQDNDSL
ncbi:MAG: YtxH domain-containing protein [Pseudanabaena sp. CRU_2_10]|nr:YtxH domain-containing protein [Pseudanabaena sp. CRU_2_10]